ncbi:glutathione S-transferase family protein [Methyloferula stellata]|uniref:glutathione S-transferase family protein n=1 Tax=Methyloferula stellata TaxID=876270 RepID=UPI000364B6ED|nr:glutathione S-transferase family protein [Methyloferula stellata]
MGLKLVIANKAYSSWSFRPWILLRHFEIPFEEIVIPMAQEETRANMLRYAPTGKCPSLHDGDISVWESLAIIEYVAESFPALAIWPRDRGARAYARSLSAEMHSGFTGLRSHLPTVFRRAVKKRELTPEAEADLIRVEAAWADARTRFGAGGAFLFGNFSAADAMFAPVVERLRAYDAPVSAATRSYMETVMALPSWQEWVAGAQAEPWRIEKYDAI